MFELSKNNVQLLKSKEVIIFDRDGVLNRAPLPPNLYITSIKDLEINTSLLSFISILQKNNRKCAVATNQQAIYKKIITMDTLDDINNSINRAIIEAKGNPIRFYVCTHGAVEKCSCRKPSPGLLLNIISDFKVNRTEAVFVGDQATDQEAASRAGIDFVFYKFQ